MSIFTQNQYRVTRGDVDFGIVDAGDEQHALDQCARQLGFRSELDMEIVLGVPSGFEIENYYGEN